MVENIKRKIDIQSLEQNWIIVLNHLLITIDIIFFSIIKSCKPEPSQIKVFSKFI